MAIANVKAAEDLFKASRSRRSGVAPRRCRVGAAHGASRSGRVFLTARQPAALAPRSANNADLDGARAPSGGRAGPL